ncbi:MAG: excinuclease ABC subunit UvrA [Phycisphaerales bacterium]|nr:excinuclease ABC subunit UvrA [Phycisphaerales bacterium]
MSNPPSKSCISIRGAREHNLQSLNLDIQRDRLVVLTGVSGSGKSSLAFDTIFAEGQRKYMESLSAYARQFLNQMHKPDVDSIEGLPPTIAIEQRSGGHSPRSTVATTTEIHDYLRLLYARCGEPSCWHQTEEGHTCGLPIAATNPTQIVETLTITAAGCKIQVCAPVVRQRKGHHREALEGLQRAGFMRARVNGKVLDIREALSKGGENPLGLARFEKHSIEAVVDRLVVSAADRQRLVESVETALRTGDGSMLVLAEHPDGTCSERRFSTRFSCVEHPDCSLEELEPRLFSFNSPQGACPKCSGLGVVELFDPDLAIPDRSKGVTARAIEPFHRFGPVMNARYGRALRKFCDGAGIERDTPIAALPPDLLATLLYGNTHAEARPGLKFEGVIPNLRRRYLETTSELVRERLRSYLRQITCPDCGGKRLHRAALAVHLVGQGRRLSIADLSSLPIARAIEFIGAAEMSSAVRPIAAPILKEVMARLGFLESVGLGYLTLDRGSATLSGGEAQRIRLATQVGSGLVGVCYVLDEPTIGLHQRDNARLIKTLRRLTDIGNSVLVVEHDEEMIRSCDHLIDIGPGPGRHGGLVVAQGTVEEVCRHEESLTAQYLSGRKQIPLPSRRRALQPRRAVQVLGATANNLQGIDVSFPLGGIVCVTGVSGSGKSTLVNDILLTSLKVALNGSKDPPGSHGSIKGIAQVERVVEVDQSPIGRTPRSNPATYTGIFDHIRSLFARTPEALIRGYEPGRFSFNVKGGRCEACQGQGVRRIEMHFLPDVFVTCEVCKGNRYNRETTEVHLKGRTIADVLDMTVEDACAFFEFYPRVFRMLECLREVGLGYVQLGQASTTLSGGEAQRVKLATELGSSGQGHTLYVLDEPTTGLHFEDVARLLLVLNRLADAGHSLVVIEHNLEVIKCADWIIDLGPEGGDEGGSLVAVGTPETVAANNIGHTAAFLAGALRGHAKSPSGTTASGVTGPGAKRSRQRAQRG